MLHLLLLRVLHLMSLTTLAQSDEWRKYLNSPEKKESEQ
jgi:hypothetical protein